MLTFMDTLDPNSQAFVDARASIAELAQNFIDLGGVIPSDIRITLDTFIAQEKATALHGELQDMYDTLQDLDDQDAQIEVLMDISDAKQKILELTAQLNALTQEAYVPPPEPIYNPHLPPPSLHTGGLVSAHTGKLFPNETIAKLLDNEFVMRPAVTQRFGADALANFNMTLNPSALGGKESGSNQPVKIDVRVMNPGPNTSVEVIENGGYDAVKTLERHFEVEENPYA